jgi:hypothetical protein
MRFETKVWSWSVLVKRGWRALDAVVKEGRPKGKDVEIAGQRAMIGGSEGRRRGARRGRPQERSVISVNVKMEKRAKPDLLPIKTESTDGP